MIKIEKKIWDTDVYLDEIEVEQIIVTLNEPYADEYTQNILKMKKIRLLVNDTNALN